MSASSAQRPISPSWVVMASMTSPNRIFLRETRGLLGFAFRPRQADRPPREGSCSIGRPQ